MASVNDFGKRLDQFIKENFKKQGEFAKAIGVRDSAVTMWIKGEREPHIRHIVEICQKYNLSLNWLMLGEGDMYI